MVWTAEVRVLLGATAVPWPSWQQAWIASAVLMAVAAILRRRRPTAWGDAALPAVSELIVLTGLYGLWRTAKKLPLTQADGAIDRARRIVEIQEAIGLPSELGSQQFLLRNDWLGWLAAAYYYFLHVPALFAFLIWMFWRHRDQYGRWRNALALTTAGCLFIRFWHVAPPRFLTDLGFVDLSVVHNLTVYGPVGTGVSGQFVAMPSIHVAWAAIVGFGVMASSSSGWRWLFAAHLPITVFVVSATGHHWWLDGIVAIGLLFLGLIIDALVRRFMVGLRPPAGDPTTDAVSVGSSREHEPD